MRSLRLAALFAVLVLAVAPGAAVAADPSDAAATVEQARVERYWSADRMARAIPRDMVLTGSGGSGSQPQTLAVAEVPGASWTTGGEILERSGKVFFSLASGDYVCSASVIQDGADPAYSLVITAGHCVYDQAEGAFATNWVYVPEYDTEPGDYCWTPRMAAGSPGRSSPAASSSTSPISPWRPLHLTTRSRSSGQAGIRAPPGGCTRCLSDPHGNDPRQS